jgi:hypothetical protein
MRKTAANGSCVIYGVRKCSLTIACILKDCNILFVNCLIESKRSAPLIGWNSLLKNTLRFSIGSVVSEFHRQGREDESTVEPVLCFLDILNSILIYFFNNTFALIGCTASQICSWDMPCSAVKSADVSEEHNASKCMIRLYLLLASCWYPASLSYRPQRGRLVSAFFPFNSHLLLGLI